jgi:hypothetical protein
MDTINIINVICGIIASLASTYAAFTSHSIKKDLHNSQRANSLRGDIKQEINNNEVK